MNPVLNFALLMAGTVVGWLALCAVLFSPVIVWTLIEKKIKSRRRKVREDTLSK